MSDRLLGEDAQETGKAQKMRGWSSPDGRPSRWLLLRHGQTPMSIDRQFSGSSNPELTSLGREQAQRAAKNLASVPGIDDVPLIVVSPLTRTQQTAEYVSAELPNRIIEVNEGFRECDFGQWEGLTFAEVAQQYPTLLQEWLHDPTVEPPGGESLDAVNSRVAQARKELIAQYGHINMIVVSHVTPIKSVLREAMGSGPELLYRVHLDLASLSVAEFYNGGGSTIRMINSGGSPIED